MTRRDDDGLLWLRERWQAAVDAGETELGWTAWCAESGIMAADNHGWDDKRRVRIVSIESLTERRDHGPRHEPQMHPIIPLDEYRKRRRRRPPKAKAA